MKIKSIIAREVLDSRGNPTVESVVELADGSVGWGVVPSGASVGSHDAHELRDEDPEKYNGMGVLKAIDNVINIIAPDLIGPDFKTVDEIDQRMISLDGTADKSRLGANAMLPVSIAFVQAMAASAKMPLYRFLGGETATLLPMPLMNIMNGGQHATDASDFQEFMIVPIGADNYRQALQMGLEVYYTLKATIEQQHISSTVGDEGGFGLPNATTEQTLDVLLKAIEGAGYRPGREISIALDPAASVFYQNGRYVLKHQGLELDEDQMRQFIVSLTEHYPVFSVEDPLFNDSWQSYQELTAQIGDKVQIVGDDLFSTDIDRLKKGVEEHCANAILIKPNQIGTVSEVLAAVEYAKAHHFATIVSHRSGDTTDTFIADLAVATGAGQIKAGSPARGERTAKYNRLLRIEEELADRATFPVLV